MTYGRNRHRLQCAHCLAPFWTDDRQQQCCSTSCAARLRCGLGPAVARPVVVGESAAAVERRFDEARAARLAEERRNGRRRYTIEDGWQQRAGRSTLDGEVCASEMALE